MAALLAQGAKFAMKNPQLTSQLVEGVLPGGLPGGLPDGNIMTQGATMLMNRQGQIDAEAAEMRANAIAEKAASIGEAGVSQRISRQSILNLIKALVPYLVLFLIIFILWWIFSKGSSIPMPTPNKKNVNKGGLWNNFMKQINSLFSFSHEARKFFRMFSPLSGDPNTIDRPVIGSGRCNNIEWIETDGEAHIANEGDQGYCETTILPNDIKWKLDTSKMPEYGELPKVAKDSVKKQLDVIIPWDHNDEASFYVPQCDKAVYANTCDPKDPKNYNKCKRADLLEDNGMTCRLREQTSLMYREGKRCNNSPNVGIINPKNYRILTLLQRLQNKLDQAKTSKEMINVYVDNVTGKDHAITNTTNNPDLPFTYPLNMLFAKLNPNYSKGQINTVMRSYIPSVVAEQKAAEAEKATSEKSTAPTTTK